MGCIEIEKGLCREEEWKSVGVPAKLSRRALAPIKMEKPFLLSAVPICRKQSPRRRLNLLLRLAG